MAAGKGNRLLTREEFIREAPAAASKEKPVTAKRLPPNAGKGRPKGSPNKVTKEFRETVKKLLEDNSENVGVWLQQVAEGHGESKPAPEKALDLLAKLAEFAAPKLARHEHTGEGGGPMQTVNRIELVPLSGNSKG